MYAFSEVGLTSYLLREFFLRTKKRQKNALTTHFYTTNCFTNEKIKKGTGRPLRASVALYSRSGRFGRTEPYSRRTDGPNLHEVRTPKLPRGILDTVSRVCIFIFTKYGTLSSIPIRVGPDGRNHAADGRTALIFTKYGALNSHEVS